MANQFTKRRPQSTAHHSGGASTAGAAPGVQTIPLNTQQRQYFVDILLQGWMNTYNLLRAASVDYAHSNNLQGDLSWFPSSDLMTIIGTPRSATGAQ
jgi:hypothetical protein